MGWFLNQGKMHLLCISGLDHSKRGTTMTALIICKAQQALANRKGVTALEYALIAAAVAGIVLAAFNGLFSNLSSFIKGISFVNSTAG